MHSLTRLTSAALSALALGVLAGCGSGPATQDSPPPAADAIERSADTGRVAPGSSAIYPAADRTAAPDLTGELLEGGSFDPALVAGQVVVVNFWASWCRPCRDEADDLEATYTATRTLGVRFLGVNVRDTRAQARSFSGKYLSYPSIVDSSGRFTLGFTDVSPNAIPATLIVDRTARVAVVLRKPITQQELEPLVRRIADEQVADRG